MKARKMRELITLAISLLLFISEQTVLALNEPAWVITSDPEVSTSALKEYLSNKYVIKEVESYLRLNEYGTSRSLHIRGDLTLKRPITVKAGEHGRARAVAQAFLEEEAVPLFGITNLADIQEFEVFGQSNWMYIVYRQYVGDLPLSGAIIQIQIGPDERISSVDAYLEPIPSELLRAVSRKTLSEVEIRRIVEDDIKAMAQSPETGLIEFEKLATSSPPYVIWKAYSVWEYAIDAFTGGILKKLPKF